MIIVRILITIFGVIGWVFFLKYKDGGLGSSSVIDVVYVMLFIGINVFLEMFKLCRLDYLPKYQKDGAPILTEEEEMSQSPGKKNNKKREEGPIEIDSIEDDPETKKMMIGDLSNEKLVKFNRETMKYLMIAKVILIPIWSAFLIVFIASYGGDAYNIIYFALAPFDSLMDGVFDRSFISQVNGIMINTHKKMFKYQAMISLIIRVAMWMNYNMLLIQSVLIFLIVKEMFGRESFTEGIFNLPPKTYGELVILTWFITDMFINLLQLSCGGA